uniref:Uncharacterized protein n=1 Tax=Arundo donax TaxID=35708 RepID=A0A0A9DPK3_ARUDO
MAAEGHALAKVGAEAPLGRFASTRWSWCTPWPTPPMTRSSMPTPSCPARTPRGPCSTKCHAGTWSRGPRSSPGLPAPEPTTWPSACTTAWSSTRLSRTSSSSRPCSARAPPPPCSSWGGRCTPPRCSSGSSGSSRSGTRSSPCTPRPTPRPALCVTGRCSNGLDMDCVGKREKDMTYGVYLSMR